MNWAGARAWRSWRDGFIREKALRAGVPLSRHPYLKEGTLCQVTAGPLAGLKGIVVRTKSATRLVLQVDILGRATSVEIDADMIEVIEEQR